MKSLKPEKIVIRAFTKKTAGYFAAISRLKKKIMNTPMKIMRLT